MIKIKAMFVSDLHLGKRASHAKEFLTFFKYFEPEQIFLLGDIFDMWYVMFQWNNDHDAVIEALLASKATIFYLPGNHDILFRRWAGMNLRMEKVAIIDHMFHPIKGKIYYLEHGHKLDNCLMRIFVWIIHIFNSRKLNSYYHKIFEKRALKKVDFLGVDGIICGHSHFPVLRDKYMNCGDWVISDSSIVEHYDGTFDLVGMWEGDLVQKWYPNGK